MRHVIEKAALLIGPTILLATCLAAATAVSECCKSVEGQDIPRATCTAPDGSRFTLPPLRKRSINADYLVEYRPHQSNTIWYHSSLDSFGVPLGTTVYLTGGTTGAALETKCER